MGGKGFQVSCVGVPVRHPVGMVIGGLSEECAHLRMAAPVPCWHAEGCVVVGAPEDGGAGPGPVQGSSECPGVGAGRGELWRVLRTWSGFLRVCKLPQTGLQHGSGLDSG